MKGESFSPSQDVMLPDEWYQLTTADHFWMKWRRLVIDNFITRNGLDRQTPKAILDIGCGNGILRQHLEGSTAWTVDCADLDARLLQLIPPGRGRTLCYDITSRSLPDRYDIIFLLDVIEHVTDVKPFLAHALHHLKPKGMVVVNVPALPLLFSRYDTAVGHLRRYTKPVLKAEFAALPVELVEMRYWGFSLLPLGLGRKAAVSAQTDEAKIVNAGFKPPMRFLNRLLGQTAAVETWLLKNPPVGTSLLTAYRLL